MTTSTPETEHLTTLYCVGHDYYPTSIKPEHPNYYAISITDYGVAITHAPSLQGMLLDDFDQDIKPSLHAFDMAKSLLVGAAELLSNHPRSLGLEAKETQAYSDSSSSVFSIFGFRYGVPQDFIVSYFDSNIPALSADIKMMASTTEIRGAGVLARRPGWFAPGADPNVPGTPFLVPSYSGDGIVWGLRRVCGTACETYAQATDASAVQELVDTCMWHASDPDTATALRVLEGDENTQREVERMEYAKALSAARDAFARPKDRIKPRKMNNAIGDALSPILSGTRVMVGYGEHSLMPDSFGYHSGKAVMPYLHAATEITLRSWIMRDDSEVAAVTETAAGIIDSVAAENGCVALRVRKLDGNITYLITKRPDLIRAHVKGLKIQGTILDQ